MSKTPLKTCKIDCQTSLARQEDATFGLKQITNRTENYSIRKAIET